MLSKIWREMLKENDKIFFKGGSAEIMEYNQSGNFY